MNDNGLKTGTRDRHSPANFDPASYAYAGDIFQGPLPSEMIMGMVLASPDSETLRRWIAEFKNEALMNRVKAESSYDGNWKNGRTCDHCGSHFHYGSVYRHEPTGDLIVVGWICAAESFEIDSRAEFDHKHRVKRVANLRSRAKSAEVALAFLAEHGGLEAALTVDDAFKALDPEAASVLTDMAERLVKWGTLSPKQVKFAHYLRGRAAKRAAKEAEYAAERAAAPDWTEGRHEVTVTILSLKERDTDFGPVVKLFGKLDDGRRCWGTLPSAAYAAEPGDRLTFKATFRLAEDDSTMAFYSRPTGPSLEKKEATAEAA